jgi:ABC-type amino acid transport substrate-binding protein
MPKLIKLLTLVLWLSALSGAPSWADQSLARVLRSNRLRVGIDASVGQPYLFWNPRSQYLDGFEWDIARELATRLKVNIQPVNVPWQDQPQQLQAGKIDIILSSREQGSLDNSKFRETTPYYRTAQRFVVRQGTAPIRSFRDLIGKRVGVVTGSGGAALVETYNRNRSNGIAVFVSPDIQRMLKQLSDRQLDVLLLDEPLALWHARQNPNLAVVGEPLLPIGLVVIVNRQDEALRLAINQALVEMRQSGKLEQILRRWQLWQPQSSLRSSAD